MEYLTGYTIKPHSVTGLGEVRFTDGTNTEMGANQVTCEAYGYTYDITTGTCNSFTFNTNLNRNINNINNKNNGSNNTNELGSNTVQINGSNNTTKGFNNNCLINGSNNEIANGVDNATVLGSNGEAIRDGEFVVGSGDGIGQTSTFFLNGTTTNDSQVALFINGDTAVTTIARNTDAIYAYKIDIVSYRTGGSAGSGAVGDRGFWKIEGLVKDTTANETLTAIAAYGTVVGLRGDIVFAGADMQLKVTGGVDMNVSWTATAKFNQMKI
jgi:hypothetical protein